MKLPIQIENKASYECMKIAETSQVLARLAAEDWEKRHHSYTGFLFLAFAIEAMFIFHRKQVEPQYDKSIKCRRSEFHKETLRLCSIPLNIRCGRDYQTIEKCLKIRDSIAHGDFFVTSRDHFPPDGVSDDDIVTGILDLPAEQFKAIKYDDLVKGIEAAKQIDECISDQGYPAHQNGYRAESRTHLTLAFGVSGISTW